MKDFNALLEIGKEVSFNVIGDTYHVVTATSPVYIKLDEHVAIARHQGMGGTTQKFTKVTLYSEVAQSVVVAFGYGSIHDSRSNINGITLNTTIAPANLNNAKPLVTIGPGLTVQLAAADVTRKELRIGVKSDNADGIYFGDATVSATNQGGWIDAGGIEWLTTEGAVYAYNPHATESITVNLVDMRRV